MSSNKLAALPSDSYSDSDLKNVALAVAASQIRCEARVEEMKNLKQKAVVEVKTEANQNQDEKGQEVDRLVRERSVRENSLTDPDLGDKNPAVMSTVSAAVTVEESVKTLNSMSREELMLLSLRDVEHLSKYIDEVIQLRKREKELEQRKHHLEQLMKRLGISDESQDDVVKKRARRDLS